MMSDNINSEIFELKLIFNRSPTTFQPAYLLETYKQNHYEL